MHCASYRNYDKLYNTLMLVTWHALSLKVCNHLSLIVNFENIPSNLTVDEMLEAIDICNKKTIWSL